MERHKGGRFVLHAKALHGNPYDGHTLGHRRSRKTHGVAVCHIHGDKGYRGHTNPDKFKVWTSSQVRRVTKAIRWVDLRKATLRERWRRKTYLFDVPNT